MREIWGGEVRFGYTPIGGGHYYWYAPIVEPNPDNCQLGKSELTEMYAGFPEPVGELLAATDPASIVRTDLYDVEPMQSWSAGRVVLMGDAAHAPTPNLGQGAAQAIEDGWALAAAIDGAERPESAFRRYEEARMQRANGITRQSRRLGQLAHVVSPLVGGALHAALGAIPGPLNRWGMRRLLDVSYLEGLG
jgi:2-polyprenyl-6-methoxyphenol hydroxylase-like FAD-dependent oxidoreductase